MKYSSEKIKKMSPSTFLKLIQKAKKFLKEDEVMKKVCKEYDQDINIIDFIPTVFGDIDVSAKTDHGIVILNYKLLSDGDFFKDYSYLVHEYTHWFQQCFNTKPTKGSDEGNYLDNKYEQEGFQNQIEYISNHFGKEEAENYVDHLIDHHDVEENEVDDKKEILMAKI